MGVSGEYVVKFVRIVEILRYGDPQVADKVVSLLEMNEGNDEHHQTDQRDKDGSESDIAHRGGKSGRHGEEDADDLLGGSGYAAEAYQRERAHDRDAGADAAVDEHDHGLYDRGDQEKRQ